MTRRQFSRWMLRGGLLVPFAAPKLVRAATIIIRPTQPIVPAAGGGGGGLLTGLVSAWDMEDATGASRIDASGNGHTLANHGTVNQDATHIEGSFAGLANTTSSWLDNSDAALTGTTKFTGMIWFRASAGLDGKVLIGRWGDSFVWVLTGGSGHIQFGTRSIDQGSTVGLCDSTVSTDGALNKWHCAFFGYDSDNQVNFLQVDRETKVTAANTVGLPNQSAKFAVFSLSDSLSAGNACNFVLIDQTAVWGRVLSAGDISTILGDFDFAAQTGTPLFFSGWQ